MPQPRWACCMISRSRKGGKHKGSKSIASCEVVRRSGATLRGMLAKLQNDYAADGVPTQGATEVDPRSQALMSSERLYPPE